MLREGDKVQMRHYKEIGEVVKVVGKRAIVSFRTMEVCIPLDNLHLALDNTPHPVIKPKAIRLLNISSDAFSTFNTEVDLHGMQVLEALQLIEKWIDRAALVGHKDLKVIHGKGTGALRNALYNYLNKHEQVKRILKNHPYSGGDGVTWLELK